MREERELVPYAAVREFLERHGYILERVWPRPIFVFVKPGRKPKGFPVRDKQVRKEIFERIKIQFESEEGDDA